MEVHRADRGDRVIGRYLSVNEGHSADLRARAEDVELACFQTVIISAANSVDYLVLLVKYYEDGVENDLKGDGVVLIVIISC